MRGILQRALYQHTSIEIIYMSKSGILTQRQIKVLEIHETTIKAFCLLRNKKRTFKIDSILSAAPRKKGAVKFAN
ncbi:hypothetical protein [Bacillus sp. REN16]|uniref:hypothetical protein n=1 Tax=Bacillus sp. REN16 TaxID=2887296 RepID=UPI001E629BD3|nr:hypothetical protein [Bacillus sp. REN16]MCC3358554.1 hypothetical protein [Bacillus sp. REN16]